MRLHCLLPLVFVACLNQQTGGALVQQTAQELNVNARFGRMELASESVAPTYREHFTELRKDWGNNVRVADTELAGLQMKTPLEAVVLVRVAWFKIDQGDLRGTTVKQVWRQLKGSWLLASEERNGGDLGLLGERIETLVPEGPRQHAQFPTVRIGATD